MLDRDIGRRFLARIMDYLIFVPVILLFLCRAVRLRPAGNPVVTVLVLLVLFFPVMLLAEPCELALTGTTIGKAVFGLYPYGRKKNGGRKPSWREAFSRTWRVLVYGYGFPFHHREKGKDISKSWQTEDCYEYVSRTSGAVFPVLLLICCIAAGSAALRIGDAPKYGMSLLGGEPSISAAEFAANFNDYCRYYGLDLDVELQEDGTFLAKDKTADNMQYPALSLQLEGERVIGFTAELHAKGKNGNFASGCTQILELLSRSLFEPESGWKRNGGYTGALKQLRCAPGMEFRSFEANWSGGAISCSRTLANASYDYWKDEIVTASDGEEGSYDLIYQASLKNEA